MLTKIITARVLPLSLLEMRLHLKLDDPGQENLLDSLTSSRASAACDFAQHYTGRAIGVQTLEAALSAFPDGALELPFPPVTQIISIMYTDAGGVVQTSAPQNYTLNDYGARHWVELAYGAAWPAARAQWDAVKVQLRCGYDAATLPDAVRSALLLILGHLHENNQAVSSLKLEEVPLGAIALLDTIKIWSF